MGKRKERRLAAITNSGRRFKLDLFAEPSGDLGDSTAHDDEVGVDTESNQRSGIPNSPSASENPLLLLGQYSDDELEEDLDTKLDNCSGAETFSPNNKDEVVAMLAEGRPDLDVSSHEVEQPEIKNDTVSLGEFGSSEFVNKTASDETGTGDICNGTKHDSRSATYENDPVREVLSGWQMVLHEESNQYYYWNTETGETSWVPPEGLTQADEFLGGHETRVVPPEAGNVSVSIGEENLGSAVKDNVSGVPSLGGTENNVSDDINFGIYNVNSDSFDSMRAGDTVRAEDEVTIDIWSRLITVCEALLERLKSVKESKNQLQSLDWIFKYNLEVEIRLSDIKTLSSFGSSMHQFWVHSERQLKRLEDSINLEIYKIAESAVTGDTLQESLEHESEANEAMNEVHAPCSENKHDSEMRVDSSFSELVNESTLEQSSGPVEDVDMDVDMEVEDDASAGNASDELPSTHTSSEVMAVPPPPDEEWIPPPPPDHENIPPPPPDEAPDSKTNVDQYGFSIPNPDPAYYGYATTTDFYGQVEGSQVVASHPGIFYSAALNAYAETPQVSVDSAVPAAYYEFQTGGLEPPQPQCEPALSSYGILGSDHHVVFSNPPVEAAQNLLPSVQSSEVLPPIQAPAIVPENESVQLLPSSAVSASVSKDTKAHTKVARSKKRTAAVAVAATLRSSKKVSNMVNKWRAAKEEMLEDEEEPQTPLEKLERKRQKDIEEWVAQQIASGEAKSNANFQPLGGDWRERVKRRRTQVAAEAAHTSPQPHNDESQKPDLTRLSKDLPSGWQVYWDESSKQVYYGNVVTSKTAWTRPAT